MRVISSEEIKNAVERLCIDANLYLPSDIKEKINEAYNTEENETAKSILKDLIDNYKIAEEEKMPVCQDTGMAVFFVNIGNKVVIEGDTITKAINDGVKEGYEKGYLRKSNGIYFI